MSPIFCRSKTLYLNRVHLFPRNSPLPCGSMYMERWKCPPTGQCVWKDEDVHHEDDRLWSHVWKAEDARLWGHVWKAEDACLWGHVRKAENARLGAMCGNLVLYRAHIAHISFSLHTPSLGTKLPCLLLAFDPVGNEANCLRIFTLGRLLALEINWTFFFTICLRLTCLEDLGFPELGTLVFPDFLTYHLQRKPSSEQVWFSHRLIAMVFMPPLVQQGIPACMHLKKTTLSGLPTG